MPSARANVTRALPLRASPFAGALAEAAAARHSGTTRSSSAESAHGQGGVWAVVQAPGGNCARCNSACTAPSSSSFTSFSPLQTTAAGAGFVDPEGALDRLGSVDGPASLSEHPETSNARATHATDPNDRAPVRRQ